MNWHKKITVKRITHTPLEWEKVGRRLYRMKSDGCAWVETDTGTVQIKWKKGFITDGRSGGMWIDWLFPNWGSDLEKVVVICHDILFHDFDLSFEFSNELLRASMRCIGYSNWRSELVHTGVSTAIAYKAFGAKNSSEWANRERCDANWISKSIQWRD